MSESTAMTQGRARNAAFLQWQIPAMAVAVLFVCIALSTALTYHGLRVRAEAIARDRLTHAAPVIADLYAPVLAEIPPGRIPVLNGRDAARLDEILREDAELMLRNRDGTVWLKPEGKLLRDVPQRMKQYERLTYQSRELPPFAAAEAVVPGTDWVVVLASPMTWMRARPHKTLVALLWSNLAVVLVGAGLFVYGAWLLNRTQRRADDAEDANRAKSSFLSMMSHELRTPLNAIAGYTELLDTGIYGPVNDQQHEALARLKRNQAHLLTLIEDLLHFARIEAGRITYAVDDVELAPLFQSVTEIVEQDAERAGIDLVVRSHPPGIIVRADTDKLRQVILNLVGNAIKFTPANGIVELSYEPDGDDVRIYVRDTGRGIPRDRLAHIFEPFEQADRAFNRPEEGVGLGLAIARHLTRGMGGTINVESIVGQGSTFFVTLPQSQKAAILERAAV